jgi:hypothetical protein
MTKDESWNRLLDATSWYAHAKTDYEHDCGTERDMQNCYEHMLEARATYDNAVAREAVHKFAARMDVSLPVRVETQVHVVDTEGNSIWQCDEGVEAARYYAEFVNGDWADTDNRPDEHNAERQGGNDDT